MIRKFGKELPALQLTHRSLRLASGMTLKRGTRPKRSYPSSRPISSCTQIVTLLSSLITRPHTSPATPPKAIPFADRPPSRITQDPDAASFVVTVPRSIPAKTVQPLVTQMVHPATYSDRNHPVRESASPANVTVTPGMASRAAPRSPARKVNTSAPSAAPLPTMPNNAIPSPDLLCIITPFIPDEWERMLNVIPPFNKFSDVPIGMRFGFDMGVHSPPLSTYTPPNHSSALLFPDHVLSHIHNELSHRRYSGPFSRSRLEFLIGPFRSSPLGSVPKSFDSPERSIRKKTFLLRLLFGLITIWCLTPS